MSQTAYPLLITPSTPHFAQIENQPDGVRLLHILGIEHRHSGEIRCQAAAAAAASTTVTAFSELVVLPGTGAQTHLVRSFTHGADADAAPSLNDVNNDDIDDIEDDIEHAPRVPPLPLAVEEQLPALPPRIVRGPADCVALVGGSVTLSVDFTTAPADGAAGDRPTVKWLLAVSLLAHVCACILVTI